MSVFAQRRARLAPTWGQLQATTDVDRVVALPRAAGYTPVDLSGRLLPGAQGITLRPVQEQALAAIAACKGLLGGIGVGHGKTYIALFSGAVLDVDLSVVLVAPATVSMFEEVLADLQTRYRLPQTVLLSWSVLSRQDGYERLEALTAGAARVCIVADEAHYARNATAARTKRLLRLLDRRPDAAFIALSGTLTNRSLADFAHLSQYALRERSPVVTGPDLACFTKALEGGWLAAADSHTICKLIFWAHACRGRRVSLAAGKMADDQRALLVECIGERLATAEGVVLTKDPSCSASLYIVQVKQDTGLGKLVRMADEIAKTYKDPMGIELADSNEVAVTAKRLALGYYYQWEWPDGKTDTEWMDKRQDWSRTCRKLIEKYGCTGFDSRKLVEDEARRRLEQGDGSRWVRCYADWAAVQDRPGPKTRPTWVSDAGLRAMLAAADGEAALVWYDEDAVAQKLRELGLLVVPAGAPVPQFDGVVCLSLRSHGVGLNLQRWNRNVFCCVPSSGTPWEQVLGRTHRVGQQEDEVWAYVPQWTGILRHALKQAREDAAWIEKTTGNIQKLLVASVV